MHRKLLISVLNRFFFIFLPFTIYSQSDSLMILQQENEKVLEWLEDLYDHGVSTSKDSVAINKEI